MMITDLLPFLGVSALVIITPGQDTALTIRNTLLGTRGGGVATAAGVATGQAVWTLATSAGLAGLLVASASVFMAIKLLGAAYLVFLGGQALWLALRGSPSHDSGATPQPGPRLHRCAAYRQGVLSNLGNPKMFVFFSSLLPQFVTHDTASFSSLLLLGLLFCSMTFTWLTGYAIVVARAGDILRRAPIRRTMEAVTGVVLVGLGLRLAAEKV